MSTRIPSWSTVAVIAVLTACSDYGNSPTYPSVEAAVEYSSSGAIAPTIQAFNLALGEPFNAGAAGEQPTGRREIGWDGGLANPFNNRNDFPAAFFNSNVKAGVVFTTPGTGFRNDSTLFADINRAYADEFSAFTPSKIFSPVGSNVMEVLFQVAGQPTPAVVSGFGVVLSDVDLPDRTSLEFFGADGALLLRQYAPSRSDADGNVFVGATFATAVVARVRLTLGTGALSATNNDVSAGGAVDVVVADNFIYGEPRAIR
jgi:hypothetical protein